MKNDYDLFCELLSDYRKYTYEFALTNDLETYDLMIERQCQLHNLFLKVGGGSKEKLPPPEPPAIPQPSRRILNW